MNILLIEDDTKIARLIKQGLETEGFEVTTSADGRVSLKSCLESTAPDLVVLDLMLPGRDGLSTLKDLKRENRDLPVLILSAKHSAEDRIRGLREGADDYLVKPFSFPELVLRVQNLLRRRSKASEETPSESVLSFDDLSVDLIQRKVIRAGHRIDLQAKELDLLACFLRNPEKILSKAFLLKEIWGYDFDPQTNVVDVLVCRLRNKIERGFDTRLIHTIRGLGYVCRKA